MPETETEAMRNFFGPRFVVGQAVEYCGVNDSPKTIELFEELYGLKPGNRYVVEGEKVNIVWGTAFSPGGPQADSSYQEIRLDGVEEKERDLRHPFFPSAWFIPIAEEQTAEQNNGRMSLG